MLRTLMTMGSSQCTEEENLIKIAIATSSGKMRIPASVDATGLRSFFPPEAVHAGDTDYDPPLFVADPSSYHRAADWCKVDPRRCIAVEDSATGIGSAVDADIALVVGYVGGSHIDALEKDERARSLMAGKWSNSGRGAAVVLEQMEDLPRVVKAFIEESRSDPLRPVVWEHPRVTSKLTEKCNGKTWVALKQAF
eukprot:FR740424.1.p1 GENE.FR740424.1~~FR740424.1.p1  ORF type:complete len:215 (+),score=11.00 FR740424.1:62-646(+)